MASVHVLGSLNVDHPVRVARHPAIGETVRGEVLDVTPGGKGLNQAVAAALAGAPDGVAVHLHGTVGDDEDGRWLIEVAASHGVQVDHVRVDPAERTGSAWITVAGDGANTVIVDTGANRSTGFVANVDAGGLAASDVVVTQLEVPDTAVAAILHAAGAVGAHGIFNPSPVGTDGTDGTGGALMALASIVVVNEHELCELAGEPRSDPPSSAAIGRLAAMVRSPEQTLVVTLGESGALTVGPEGSDAIAGIAVEAVDTTGAGDCFLGVLAASLAGGRVLPDALRRANRAAARSVTRSGAVDSMPSAAEIDAGQNGPEP